MRIRVTAGFWIALGSFWLLDRWGLTPPFLLAAALHEAAHLAALRALGIPVRSLELRAGGALIRAGLRGLPREAWALAAGPLSNLLLALLFWRLWPRFGRCCLALGLWNLFPLPGRDGAALLRLWRGWRGPRTRRRRAGSPERGRSNFVGTRI